MKNFLFGNTVALVSLLCILHLYFVADMVRLGWQMDLYEVD